MYRLESNAVVADCWATEGGKGYTDTMQRWWETLRYHASKWEAGDGFGDPDRAVFSSADYPRVRAYLNSNQEG